uniref:SH3 domain-containing protein n=1 Tax=Amphiprion percula TaxID=161767 RepID=A0A3P8RKN2_AMPPE
MSKAGAEVLKATLVFSATVANQTSNQAEDSMPLVLNHCLSPVFAKNVFVLHVFIYFRCSGDIQHFKVFCNGKYFLVDHHLSSPMSCTRTTMLHDLEVIQETHLEALYDFEAKEEGELSFKHEEMILLLDNPDGIFPYNYETPVKRNLMS